MSRLNGHDAPNHFFVAKWFCVVWAFVMLASVHENGEDLSVANFKACNSRLRTHGVSSLLSS